MKKLSKKGYRNDSPDKNNSYNIIPSGRISMSNVNHDVFGIDELGNSQMMSPGQEFQFPGNTVFEIPMKQMGGQTADQWNNMNLGKGYKPSPGSNVNLAGKGKYLDFYDPNKFQPSNSGVNNATEVNWNKVNDPSWRYSNEDDSPFMKYSAPTPPPRPLKKFTQASSNRTAVGFQPNYTTYKYEDGSTKYQDTSGNIYNDENQLTAYLETVSKKALGGPLNKFTSNYAKRQIKNMEAPQGVDMDQYLTDLNMDFVKHISDNTRAVLLRDEISNHQTGYKQAGGPYVQLDNPDNPLQTRTPVYPVAQTNASGLNLSPINQPPATNLNINPNNDFYNSKFGIYADQPVPEYVTNFRSTQAPVEQQNNSFNSSDIADIGLAGVQVANSLFDRANENKQNKFNMNKLAIDQTSQTQYGSRGDYDINSGAFRPDQYTPTRYQKGGTPSYKKGGEYSLSHKELASLVAQGYQVDFLD